jgi:hypothetical protein
MTGLPPGPQRTGVMALARLSGATLEEIAGQHGVTRERVRQILERVGVRSSGFSDDVELRSMEAVRSSSVESFAGVARIAGLTRPGERALFRRWVHASGLSPALRRLFRLRRRRRLLRALCAIATVTGKARPGKAEIDRLGRAFRVHVSTLQQTFGSLWHAQELAGFPADPHPPRGRKGHRLEECRRGHRDWEPIPGKPKGRQCRLCAIENNRAASRRYYAKLRATARREAPLPVPIEEQP